MTGALRLRRPLLLVCCWLLACALLNLAHAAVQPVPPLVDRVVDLTRTLQPAEIATLDAKLKALEAEKGAQVVVLMVDSTAPEDIFSYSNRVANAWKIGRADVGDGVLIVVAKGDKRMRIEVAKALEGAVTDISSGRILNEAMGPRFRNNDYAGGIEAAVDAVSALIRQEPLPLPAPPIRTKDSQFLFDGYGVFILLLVFLGVQALRRSMGTPRAAMLVAGVTGIVVGIATASIIWGIFATIAALVVSLFTLIAAPSSGGTWRSGGSGSGGWSTGGSWTSSGGGSGGSSGGFSSGGGGSFGGGGASGSW